MLKCYNFSMLTSVAISVTQYMDIFDIMSPLLFFQILLLMSVYVLNVKFWSYHTNCPFQEKPMRILLAKRTNSCFLVYTKI